MCLAFFTAEANVGGKKKKKAKATSELTERQEVDLKNTFLEANKHKLLGNNEEAVKLFERCLTIDPNNSASHYELASLKLLSQQIQPAVKHMETAAEIDPDNKWYQQSLAIFYEQLKFYSLAVDVYNGLIEKYPGDITYYENLANMYLYQNDLKGALKVYNQIENKFGVQEFSSTQKQKIYVSQKKPEKAIEEAEKLVNHSPGTARYYTGLAELYKGNDQNDKAIETYQKLLKIDPNNAYVQLSMSLYYFEGGKNDDAKDAMRNAFKNSDLDFTTKARILFNEIAYRDVPEGEVNPFGIELAKILEETHPGEAKSYAVTADLLYQAGDKQGALDSYEKSLKIDENQFIIWSQTLLLYSEINQWDSIYVRSSEALELFPNQPSLYYFQGISAYQKKMYQETIDALETGKDFVIDNNNLLGQFYTNLGDAHHNLDQHEQSDKYFEKALRLNPNDDLVLNNYSYYLSLRGEKLERAAEMAKQVVERNPKSATYLDTYAWVLYRKGDFADAKNYMEQAISNGGEGEVTLIEHYGDILFKLDDINGAMKYWEQAKTMGGGSDLLDKKIESKQLYE
ncbi:MAG: tetratricopeptide repeat protein [Salibacteraceae bacterium]